MSKETVETLKKYFGSGSTVLHFLGNGQIAQEVASFLSKGKYYSDNRPDMAILYNGKCLAIEHFEFDCYKKARGGSKHRKEQARIERAFKTVPPNTQGVLCHEEIKGKSTYEQYINNIRVTFSEHYFKISEYKRNLIDMGVIDRDTHVKMAFLIEDVSPLGSLVYDEKGAQPIVLALCKEFLELLRKSPDVEYIIACSSAGATQYTWLISREELDEYERNSIDYASMSFIEFTPQVMATKITIPTES